MIRRYLHANSLRMENPTSRPDHQAPECSICLDAIVKSKVSLPCSPVNHEFHATCISDWVLDQNKDDCPICRRIIDLNERLMIAESMMQQRNRASFSCCMRLCCVRSK